MAEEREYSVTEAAELLGITPAGVRIAIKHNRIRATKRDGKWVVRLSASETPPQPEAQPLRDGRDETIAVLKAQLAEANREKSELRRLLLEEQGHVRQLLPQLPAPREEAKAEDRKPWWRLWR